jgi:hypothetical protein
VRMVDAFSRTKADLSARELVDWAVGARKMLVCRCTGPHGPVPMQEVWLLTLTDTAARSGHEWKSAGHLR